MAIQIRAATTGDTHAIAVLMIQLGYPTTNEEMAMRMEQLNKLSDYCCLLALEDEVITGMIGFSRCYAWEINNCYVRIQTLVTDGRYRTKGTGKALIDACKAWAKANGAIYLSLNCGNKTGREAAHRFYPHVGFTASSTGYIMNI